MRCRELDSNKAQRVCYRTNRRREPCNMTLMELFLSPIWSIEQGLRLEPQRVGGIQVLSSLQVNYRLVWEYQISFSVMITSTMPVSGEDKFIISCFPLVSPLFEDRRAACIHVQDSAFGLTHDKLLLCNFQTVWNRSFCINTILYGPFT